MAKFTARTYVQIVSAGALLVGLAGTSHADNTTLTVAPPSPGYAGVNNSVTITLSGNTKPLIYFLVGTKSGATPVKGCPGLATSVGKQGVSALTGLPDGNGQLVFTGIAPVEGTTLYLQAVAPAICQVSNLVVYTFTQAPPPITIGETNILATDDNGNGNLLVAQQATLSQTATIQSLSFYVSQVSGNLRLGLYDATGPGGGPGHKKTETNDITPVVGWNTVNVTSPITLAAGTYWLAYLPSDSNLHFRLDTSSGSARWYPSTYGSMPSAFSTSPSSGSVHWSLYATLLSDGTPPPPDTIPPTAPGTPSVSPISSSQLNLSWGAASDNVGVTGYFVDVSTSDTFASFVSGWNSNSVGNTLSASVTGLTPATTYYARVRATDGTNVGPNSGTVSATTPNGSSGGTYGPIGINIEGVEDFMGSIIFKNMFLMGRQWNQGTCSKNLLDAQGYPLSVPLPGGAVCGDGGSIPWTLIERDTGGHYPAGVYKLMFDGIGTLHATYDAIDTTCTSTGTANCSVQVNPSGTGVRIEILSSSAANHVRNIRFVPAQFESSYATDPFYPTFAASLANFKILRFMQFFRTNGNPNVTWADRRLPDYYTQASYGQNMNNGSAIEWAVDIANMANANIWVNIPYLADDDYVRNFADLVRDRLHSNLKVYVEFSNEVWNQTFLEEYLQGACFENPSGQQACVNTCKNYSNIKLPNGDYDAYWNHNECKDLEHQTSWYAQRAAHAFAIFDQEFAATPGRLLKVLAWQAVSSWWGGIVMDKFNGLTYNPAHVKADLFAIAPYFPGENVYASLTPSTPLSTIFQGFASDIANKTMFDTGYKDAAQNHGLLLTTYEGGISTPNPGGVMPSNIVTANRDPQMKQIYLNYMQMLHEYGFDTFMQFQNVFYDEYYGWQHGTWGLLEWQDQDPNSTPLAPKWLAVQEALQN